MKTLISLFLLIISFTTYGAEIQSYNVYKNNLIEANINWERYCIEGIQYLIKNSSYSSFTVMMDSEGKPLQCKISGYKE